MGERRWKTRWTYSKKAGLHMVVVCCSGPGGPTPAGGGVVPRGHGTGPDSSHLLRQNMRIHSGANLSPFPFLLPKNG